MAENNQNKIIQIKCDLCSKKFTEALEVACGHKFCLKCFGDAKKKNIICMKCKHFTNRRPVKIVLPEEAIPESLQESVGKAKELTIKYKNILLQRERECSSHVDQLEKSIKDLKHDENKKLHDLSKVFDVRLNTLKAHYGNLRKEFKTSVQKRIDNLGNIIKDVRKSLDEIRTSLTNMAANIDAIFEKRNFDKIDGAFMEDLETRCETREMIEIDIPAFEVDINETEDFDVGDSLTITAPEPSILRKSIKADTPPSDLSALRDKCLALEREIKVPADVHSLSLVANQLCLSEGFEGFSLYDKELKKQRTVEAGSMGCVYDVSGLADKSFVVAAKTGLFHVSEEGEVVDTFAKGCYTSTVTRGGVIYAGFSDPETKPPCQIHAFQENSAKKVLTSFPCQSDHHIMVALGKDLMYVSCKQDHTITIMSMQSGTIMKVISKALDQFNLDSPSVNLADENDRALVCERNNRIHVMLNSGLGYPVKTEKTVKKPVGVVYHDGYLYAVNKERALYSFKRQ